MTVEIFFCEKKGHQVDQNICMARQNKGICKCKKGIAIMESIMKSISRTRTRKEK